MPRSKVFGYLAIVSSLTLAGFFIYLVFIVVDDISRFSNVDLERINSTTYFAVATPIVLVTMIVIGTGFWIGWTILSIKVVPPMPEIVEKRDYSKIKAVFLCLFCLSLAGLLIYGIVIRNFWALAIPAAVISLVILGAIFWVGIAIITTRSTLPEEKKET